MSIEITQTAQFKIKELSISSKFGKIDVGGIFDELNIFDTMLMPCMSGNIVIRDALGLSSQLYFDGSEYININIGKEDEEGIIPPPRFCSRLPPPPLPPPSWSMCSREGE